MKTSNYVPVIILILSLILSFNLPVKQTYSEESVAFEENFLKVILGENVTGWYYYKMGNRRSIIGMINYNPNEETLTHLFDYYTPDEFTYKPVAVEDTPTKVYVTLQSKADEKHNYILIGKPVSVYLLGPEKYGGIGQYMLIYTYKRLGLIKADITLKNGTRITTQSYDTIRELYKTGTISSIRAYTTVYPARMNLILVGDKRYNNWGEPEVKCSNIVVCKEKVYTIQLFSPLYQISELPKNLDNIDIPEYGLILTPFYNVTTWTYNPEYQYFTGSGTGIAWNATCGNPPFTKYNLKWMGPGDINELYSMRIIGSPNEKCCHLPAYYINFLPLWCKANSKYGEFFYNITSVINRIENVPISRISGYIPRTGVNYVYANGKLYLFKLDKPAIREIHYSSNPLVIYFNTTMRFDFELPNNTPIHEIGVIPVNLDGVSKLWFTTPKTIVTLDKTMTTLTITSYKNEISKGEPTKPNGKQTYELDSKVVNTYYDDGKVYLVTEKGTVYKVEEKELTEIGSILEGARDMSVQDKSLVVLYPSELVIYNVTGKPTVTQEVKLHSNYKWVVTSKHMVFLIGDKKVSVYKWLPKRIVEEKGGETTLTAIMKIAKTNTHKQTEPNQQTTISTVQKTTSFTIKTSQESEVETKVPPNGIRISLAAVLILILVVAYMVMKIK